MQGSPHFFVGDRGWFCPSLDISHDGATIRHPGRREDDARLLCRGARLASASRGTLARVCARRRLDRNAPRPLRRRRFVDRDAGLVAPRCTWTHRSCVTATCNDSRGGHRRSPTYGRVRLARRPRPGPSSVGSPPRSRGASVSRSSGGPSLLVASGVMLGVVGWRVLQPIDQSHATSGDATSTEPAAPRRCRRRASACSRASSPTVAAFLLVPLYLLVFGLQNATGRRHEPARHRFLCNPDPHHALGARPHRLDHRSGTRRRLDPGERRSGAATPTAWTGRHCAAPSGCSSSSSVCRSRSTGSLSAKRAWRRTVDP